MNSPPGINGNKLASVYVWKIREGFWKGNQDYTLAKGKVITAKSWLSDFCFCITTVIFSLWSARITPKVDSEDKEKLRKS